MMDDGVDTPASNHCSPSLDKCLRTTIGLNMFNEWSKYSTSIGYIFIPMSAYFDTDWCDRY